MSVKPPSEVEDADAAGLAALGYKQELRRGMSGFSNFAISFSIISILAGCITSFNISLKSGGPSAITIGWPLVGVFVLCVAAGAGPGLAASEAPPGGASCSGCHSPTPGVGAAMPGLSGLDADAIAAAMAAIGIWLRPAPSCARFPRT